MYINSKATKLISPLDSSTMSALESKMVSVVLNDTLKPVCRDDNSLVMPVNPDPWLEALDPHRYSRRSKDESNLPPIPYQSVYLQKNAPTQDTSRFCSSVDGFFSAVLRAYNDHLELILAPDDINLLVNLNLSKYVNKNPEAMRAIFVDHQGQAELTVVEEPGTKDDDWSKFFGLMQDAMRKKVNGGVVSLLENDFSTSGLVERSACAATIMNTFKAYFSYRRCIPACGIPRVHFLGTREDWVKLQVNFQKLAEFFTANQQPRLSKYYEGLVGILIKLLETFDGQPDLPWWDKIMNQQRGRLGSGSTTHFSGWFLQFYLATFDQISVERNAFNLDHASVDVAVENYAIGQKYKVKVCAGWFGTNIEEEIRIRPVMGVGVYKELASIQSM